MSILTQQKVIPMTVKAIARSQKFLLYTGGHGYLVGIYLVMSPLLICLFDKQDSNQY